MDSGRGAKVKEPASGGGARGTVKALFLGSVALAAIVGGQPALAETIGGALVKAYLNNPDVNQQRAAVRVADENVPKANAGYLPNISATADAGVAHSNANALFPTAAGGFSEYHFQTGYRPRGYGVQLTQNVFDGNKTLNSIRNADSGVLAARETLRNTEQNTLFNGATAYMDVLRDTAILELDRNNVDVLKEQLRETRDRFNVGEVTRTDVAQAEASLSSSQATEISAESTLQSSIARYRQIVGDQPTRLAPVKPVIGPLPKSLPEAIDISQVEHPAIIASLHGVDSALLQIKIAQSALYPQIGITGSVNQQFDVSATPGQRAFNAQIMGQITIPIFQGGAEYASTRQAKEGLTQTEMQSQSTRNQVRAAVVAAWGANQASLGVVRAARAAVSANEVALQGVREEAKVGQRTTLDVLNAQQALLNARVQLVIAEHDDVVNSYSLLSSVGRLNVPTLGLAVAEYDPRVHYNQVKDKWFGLQTPDGK